MAQSTYITRKGQDADVANLTVSGTLSVTGATTLTGATTATGGVAGGSAVVAVSASGAIAVPSVDTLYFITKGTAAAMTLVDPTATTHDGRRLVFISTTAAAHTLDNSAGSGFFSSGGASKDVATWGGAIGDRFSIAAYQGKWYIENSLNITLG